MHLEAITLDRIRQSASAIAAAFPLKEMELLETGGKPYFIAYRSPASQAEADRWTIQSNLDFLAPILDKEHVLVSAIHPERGVFARFDDDSMLETAKAAMPDAAIREATWLDRYDDYYYYSLPSFNLGLMKPARTLPVLRVRFDDPNQTWLYLNPSHGQLMKADKNDRVARWALYGLHALDFSFLYRHRPLWDIVVMALLVGATVLSASTLLPMYRRLRRHALRIAKTAAGRRQSQREADLRPSM